MKLIAVALLGSSLVACMRNKGDEASAESALDSADSVQAEGNIMMANIDGADLSAAALTSDDIAVRIAANIGARWPSTCKTIEQNGNAITVTYNDCTGPRGLLHVSGQLVLAVNLKTDGTIVIHGSSGDLTVNDAHLVVDVDASYSTSGTNHTLTVVTSGSAVGPRGTDLEHVGDYTITWDSGSQCGSLAGSWATEGTLADGSQLMRSTTANVMKCAGQCPVGSIVRTFRTGGTLTVTFDGTATATWEASTGKSGTIALPCQ